MPRNLWYGIFDHHGGRDHAVREFLRVIVLISLLGVKLDRTTLKDDHKNTDYIWRDLSSYNTGYYRFDENEGRRGVVGLFKEKGYSSLRLTATRYPNSDSTFHCSLLTVSGDICPTPGPVNGKQLCQNCMYKSYR